MNNKLNSLGGLASMALLAAMQFSTLASAATPSYRYAEAAYSTGDLDLTVSGVGSVEFDEDGFEIEGSFSLIDNQLWLVGSYSDLSGDEFGIDLDIETIGLGVGWIFQAGPTTSIDTSVIYREDELSTLGVADDVDGVGVAAGVRSNITELVELFGRIGYLEGDYEGGILADLGIVFNVTEQFGFSGSYEWLEADDEGVELELSQFQFGARFKF